MLISIINLRARGHPIGPKRASRQAGESRASRLLEVWISEPESFHPRRNSSRMAGRIITMLTRSKIREPKRKKGDSGGSDRFNRSPEDTTIANRKSKIANPLVSIIMGSKSDWPTMKHTAAVLDDFGVPYEKKIVSAHRTPDLLFEFAKTAESRGIEVIVAGAGGAAHLPGMCASQTVLPVLGVPVESRSLKGLDSLLSIVQMPAGIPVGTLAIGEAGAKNAGLFAISILANSRAELREKLRSFRLRQTRGVLKGKLS